MRKLALLVAVDCYDDPEITPLRYAGADAREIGQALTASCGFDVVRSLDGGPNSHKATKGAVLDALVAMAGEARPEDLLLFYFSGHGIEVDGRGYLLTADSRESFPDHTGLSFELLRHNLERMSAAHRVLLFDACRNDPRAGKGSAANTMSDALGRDLVAVARSKPQFGKSGGCVTALLSACSPGQRAYEMPDKGHGVFSHYLLEGLRGPAWPEGSSRLEFRDMAHYASREVRRWSEGAHGLAKPQEPWYEEVGSGEPIVIAHRNAQFHARPACDHAETQQIASKPAERTAVAQPIKIETAPSPSIPRPRFIDRLQTPEFRWTLIAIAGLALVLAAIRGFVSYETQRDLEYPRIDGVWENYHVLGPNGTGDIAGRTSVIGREGDGHLLLATNSGELGMDNLFDDKSSLQPLRIIRYGFTIKFANDKERTVSRFGLAERFAKDPSPRFVIEVDSTGLVEGVDYILKPEVLNVTTWFTADCEGAGRCIGYRKDLSFGHGWLYQIQTGPP